MDDKTWINLQRKMCFKRLLHSYGLCDRWNIYIFRLSDEYRNQQNSSKSDKIQNYFSYFRTRFESHFKNSDMIPIKFLNFGHDSNHIFIFGHRTLYLLIIVYIIYVVSYNYCIEKKLLYRIQTLKFAHWITKCFKYLIEQI